ncbi:MAG: leucine-rich repeat domain-containing protein [Clostridia bacterium]|nr:leucine-rich repeat domain-containing protein [Clostridia bacterium]
MKKVLLVLCILSLSLIIVSCNNKSDLIECIYCGGEIEKDSRFCSYCGESFENDSNNTENNNNVSQDNTEEKGTEGLSFYPLPDGTYAVSVGKATFLEEIVIPSTYEGKSVSQILEKGFSGCSNLKYITIPQSITFIGDYAFEDCSKLEKIDLPANIQSIGKWTFDKCASLTRIDLPNGVVSIGDWAFYMCENLQHISIPNSIEYIGESVFYGCYDLQYNKYSNANYLGNTNNPYLILMDCTIQTITSCNINHQTKIIYRQAFYMCAKLQSIVIPENVVFIGDYAFYDCTSLESAVFENPYGWFNTSKPFASSGDSISSDQLSNENTAAKFLSEYRIDSLWKRN